MNSPSSNPNPTLGFVILVIGAVLLGLISFPAVGGILFGGGLMLGLIWIVYHAISN